MAPVPLRWFEDDAPGVILYNFHRELSAEDSLVEMYTIMGRAVPDRSTIENLYRRFRRGSFNIRNPENAIIDIYMVRDVFIMLSMDARFDFLMAKYLGILDEINDFREIICLLNRRRLGSVYVPSGGTSRLLPERKSWSISLIQRLKENSNIIVADAFWIYHPQLVLPDEFKDLSCVQRYMAMPKTLAVVFCSKDLRFKLLVRIFSLNRKDTFKWYLRRPLREAFRHMRMQCPGVPLLYHYDSIMGPSHPLRVMELARYYGVELIDPPNGSADLAFSYHGLYPELRRLVRPPVIEFDNMKDVAGTEIVNNWDEIPDHKWNGWFRNWVSYLISCSRSEGRFM